MKLFSLEGQTAVVTGGGRGIGKAIALALAEAGANVAVTSRTEDELKTVCEEIENKHNRKAYYQTADIRSQESIQSFVDYVIKEEGKIDILVNGAGMNVRSEERRVGKECRARWWRYECRKS